MATTLRTTEETPADWPGVPPGLSAAAQAIDPALIWSRIEAFVAVRWSPRRCVWVVEGGGEWVPPLAPCTITSSQIWTGGAWEDCELQAGPMGYVLTEANYQITGDVGLAPPPAPALAAYARLAEYFATPQDAPGASALRLDVADVGMQSVDRHPAWMARAMVNSGAGDLLRPYRKAV